ncbi:putative nuclease HARBI1 [Triplophysa dalaica]|uniref:putative nuclease HARBI1 n=1 Tax=Triplophysa dalaica TaxID=1582913 RepID=UPI0024DF5F17|nr:putative nuclease HARBI1 [Triplophysa dalaica]XP_056595070.1 putative nuclease HARBI1 [Triplophysa dalaica]
MSCPFLRQECVAEDCTQVPIKAPPGPNEGDFLNRKGFHSVNVQMVCDSMFHITNVEATWPGSVGDSKIFRESHLCTLFERGADDGILFGDRGYAFRQAVLHDTIPWTTNPLQCNFH